MRRDLNHKRFTGRRAADDLGAWPLVFVAALVVILALGGGL